MVPWGGSDLNGEENSQKIAVCKADSRAKLEEIVLSPLFKRIPG
jgi:hypothetical protein